MAQPLLLKQLLTLVVCHMHDAAALLQVFMTFLLVMTVYAAAVAKPGHGNTAPLAIGLSLYAAALTGEGSSPCMVAAGHHCGNAHASGPLAHMLAAHNAGCIVTVAARLQPG